MNRSLITALSLFVAITSGSGRAEDATLRLALITSEKSDAVRNVLTLAEAKLGEMPHIKLVERQAIEKVLAEQKLSVSGVVAPDQALTIGKLLSVDVFAVLEAGIETKEAAGLVILDARTGVRLWDAALPAGDVDQTVTATVNAVRTALRKRNDKTRSICLMTVRNADLPRDLDGFCDSVGLLLERRLAASSDLAVLERRRLEQVNRERDLPADSPLRKLLASVVTVELDIGAAPEKKGLRATILLSDGAGKSLGKVTAQVDKRDAMALAQEAFKELAKAVNANATTAVGDRKFESWRFLREANFYLEHNEHAYSLRAAESAAALQPDDPFLRAVLARGLNRYALNRLAGFKVEKEAMEHSLSLAHRGSEVLLAVETESRDAKWPKYWSDIKLEAGSALSQYLTRFSYLKRTATEDERAAIGAIRSNLNQSFDVRIERARKDVRDRKSYQDYTIVVDRALRANALDRFVPPSEWVDQVCRLQPWTEVSRKQEEGSDAYSQELAWCAVQGHMTNPQFTAGETARLEKVWNDLSSHPHETIAVYGKLGRLVTAARSQSELEVGQQLRDFRIALQTLIQKNEKASIRLRAGLYLAGSRAFSRNSRLKLPGQFEELKEFGEFMLRRKEVFPGVVREMGESALSAQAPAQDRRDAFDFIQRALDLLEKEKGEFVFAEPPAFAGTERANFRGAMLQIQGRIRTATPSAGGAATTPWEKVTTLLDVQANTQGILWLQQPMVHEGAVYVTAVRMEQRPVQFSVQLLKLTPGNDPWEGKPLALSLRLPNRTGLPTIGPKRHGIDFAATACIHQGKYYLGTRENGIFVFPFDGSLPERISTAEGLPSDIVQNLACLGGRLYASVGEINKENYIVAVDLKTRKCDVLASSRRKDKRSPFDDNKPMRTTAMVADATRGRMLVVGFGQDNYSPLNGVWAVDAKSNEWTQLLRLQTSDSLLYGPNSRVEGDRLILNGAIGSFVLDLSKKDTQLLFDGKVSLETNQVKSVLDQLHASPGYSIREADFFNVRPPHVLVDGWVWGADPLSRRRYDSSKTEIVASLRSGPQFFHPQSLQLFRGERELLVGDAFGIWLVTLKRD